MQFGEWTVLNYLGNMKWECKCSCGNIKTIATYSLTSGASKSCRHPVREGNVVEVGEHINSWTVEENIGNGEFNCRCDCGNTGVVNVSSLRYGYSKSCGCKQGESRNKTLIERYGETDTNRVNNPRQLWEVAALNSRESFEELIEEIRLRINRKPCISDIVNILSINKASVGKTIHKYGLEDKINFYSYVSSGEINIREFISDIYKGEVNHNIKSIIQPYELDIYIPEFKLAIEFNGDYWHSTLLKDKYYHQQKTIDCAKRGIRLIHIFEYEWNNIVIREKIKGIIRRVLVQEHNKVVYARKLTVAEIDNKTAYEFCCKYHMNNGINSSVNIGIMDGKDLLGVMTFGKQRYNGENWELYRLIFKDDTLVVGGAERMMRVFIDKYNPDILTSYCDISKFTGNVYIRLGFTTSLENITKPNYVWKHLYKNIVLTRYQTLKSKLVSEGIGTRDMTEDQIMENNSYIKIYNSGNLKFTWCKK